MLRVSAWPTNADAVSELPLALYCDYLLSALPDLDFISASSGSKRYDPARIHLITLNFTPPQALRTLWLQQLNLLQIHSSPS